ncbi:hypothetical protein VaNZ11_011422 [Volvox africanus]|uniref:Pherophorin domain-containing protein n=1 Tax=Volvox africanus TaxID=51714 RepID=A0ABQ5SCH2_9CHLO|nr:hypothetical protein VaNZ11_011422 [Volvox africanus]
MDTFGAPREEGLRRALSLAIPVGTQLGSVGLESLGRAADGTLKLATWSVTSAVRTAGAGAAFVNRNLFAPLSSLAFGSGSAMASTTNIQFCTQTCPQLLIQKGRKHNPSEVRYQKAASNLRTGSAKCSIRRQQQLSGSSFASQQAELLAHLAASCALAPSSDLQDEPCFGKGDVAVAQWTVNALGLQSSML